MNYRTAAPGASFSQFEERGETDTGCILATSDEEWGKPAPALRVAAQIRPYFILALGGGPTTAFGLGFVFHPTDEDLSVGPRSGRISLATLFAYSS